ncbi:MAG: PhnD/SsuA/transferrin family substrate-binding protein, partial [Halothiobacillaceae bacterium]|nr:PhnD/SsuA/transferrin family substrate-binding protein [Halothiobacillaceae bacterium]
MATPLHAELTLSGSPSSQDRTELNKHYIELAAQLTETLGEPVRYVAPLNEVGYARDIRKGSYDILLDGPHLAAWRVAKGIHKPVVQSDVPLTFLLVAPASNKSIQSPEQLVGKHVCVQASPNLSNLMFMSLYPNPLQLPNVHVVEGFKPIAQKVLTGECSAGVLTATFYENTLDKDAQSQLRVIYNTRPLPGHVLTVSNKMSDAEREALQK